MGAHTVLASAASGARNRDVQGGKRKDEREREGASVLSRHVLLQIDFSVPVLGIFQLVVVWGRERTQLSPG